MADETDATAGDVSARKTAGALAYVCAHLDEISAVVPGAAGQGVPGIVDRLQAALRCGQDVAGALDAIHDALLREGDALGVYGHTRGVTLPGIDTDRPLEIVYRCPARRCSRTVPGPAAAPPRCGLTGEPLLWGRL